MLGPLLDCYHQIQLTAPSYQFAQERLVTKVSNQSFAVWCNCRFGQQKWEMTLRRKQRGIKANLPHVISKPRLFPLKASCKSDIIMYSNFIREVCAMKGLTLTAFLLCGSSKYSSRLYMLLLLEKSSTRCPFHPLPFVSGWIFVAGSDPQIVEVQFGENVTLQCSNISTIVTHVQWFRVVNRTEPSCVSSMFDPLQKDSLCPGFENGKFKMTSNISHLFLNIIPVNFSDSGLYFCGLYIKTITRIPRATFLNVQGKIFLFFIFPHVEQTSQLV